MNFMIWKQRLTDVLSMGIEVMLNRNSQHLAIIRQKKEGLLSGMGKGAAALCSWNACQYSRRCKALAWSGAG